MPERNIPQKTLESWKQIAAYLDRSERTVRRWEASEGLPVHRREHEKQDTVFAFRHEIEAWSRLRTRCSGTPATEAEGLPLAKPSSNTYLLEHDAITRTMHCYIAGARAGDGDLMRPAFHSSATMSGYCQGVEYSGSIEHVFKWVTENGPAPKYQSSLCPHRNHREHRGRASGSATLVRQAGRRQHASLGRIHSAEV